MPILYALVSRGRDVLAEYTATGGNFPAVTRVLLAKISPQDTKMSVSYDSYFFHYIVSDGCTYLCMADEKFRRRLPFLFLEDIRSRFLSMYGDNARTMIAFAANEEFSRVLAQQMDFYNNNPEADNLGRVRSQVDDVKNVMVQNIEKVLERNERIELLVDKTDALSQQSLRFERQSRQLRRNMWWRNVKATLLAALLVGFVIFVIVGIACGGFTFPKCHS